MYFVSNMKVSRIRDAGTWIHVDQVQYPEVKKRYDNNYKWERTSNPNGRANIKQRIKTHSVLNQVVPFRSSN